MFCFQARNEMLIDEDQIQDLILLQQGRDHHVGTVGVTAGSYLTGNHTEKSGPARPPTKDHNNIIIVQNGSKKILHKEIERRRRQEMAALHASLRTLLPLHYIKGKRSKSEHIYEAAKYIKYLKNQVTELSGKRDKLRTLSAGTSSSRRIESSSPILVPDCSVTVRPCSGGLEILSSSSFKEERSMTLSRMLRVISRERIGVVSCVSTKVEQRLLHTINTEDCDLTCMDLPGLEQKLLMEVFHNQD